MERVLESPGKKDFNICTNPGQVLQRTLNQITDARGHLFVQLGSATD